MADVTQKILKSGVVLQSVQEFRHSFDQPITSQAVLYLIKTNKIDYMPIGDAFFAIVLTDKTKQYRPKIDPRRT